MSSSAGHWVSVRFPDGQVRSDWVPTEQPPAPRGQAGTWHVVTGGPHRPGRWEWHGADRPVEQPPALPESPPVEGPAALPAVLPAVLPPVRPPATTEVLPDRVYRSKRPMGPWFWMAAVILAAIGGAGTVAMTHDNPASASLTAESAPGPRDEETEDDVRPSQAALVRVAEGYLTALLGGDVDDLVSYLDPACPDAVPGYAVAARWAASVARDAGVEVDSAVEVEEVEVRGRRGSVTELDLDDELPASARRLIVDVTADGEQSFPWRFHDGEWYFKGECRPDGTGN